MSRTLPFPTPEIRTARAVALCLALVLTAACGGDPGSAGDAVEDPATPPLSDAERSAAVERGEAAAALLQGALGSTLQQRIQADGLVGAVDFCDLQALPLTAQVTEELGVEVGRTATRLRNPANAPDPVDRRALEAFAGTSVGQVPFHLEPVGDSAVRYYKPLYAAQLCVGCHGPREELAPELARVLAERYPEDQATGYAVGDFRGVIRVTLPRASLAGGAPGA